MSSWGPKLEKKLKALADSASKESMQTLANWVWFNRKNGSAFAKTFCDALVATTTETRQWLYWQVLNESLLANRDDVEKWERASELRATLGEAAVVPALESLGRRAVTEKIEGLWKQWNDSDVFGGPTIIGQIRRLLTSPHLSVEEVEEVVIVQPPVAAPVESPPAVIQNLTKENHVDNEVTVVDLLAETTTVEPTRRSSMSSIDSGKQRRGSLSSLPGAEIEYDFESKVSPLYIFHIYDLSGNYINMLDTIPKYRTFHWELWILENSWIRVRPLQHYKSQGMSVTIPRFSSIAFYRIYQRISWQRCTVSRMAKQKSRTWTKRLLRNFRLAFLPSCWR